MTKPLERTVDTSLLPTADDIAHFTELGWWVSPPVLSDEVIASAERGAERLYAGDVDNALPDGRRQVGWTDAEGDVLRKNDYSGLLVDDLRVLTTHPLIGAMAAVLAGVDSIRLWHDQLLFKPSVDDGVTRNVGWHTDRQYWLSASSERMLTGWVPFHDVRPDHGPVMFVDGSHRWETHATGNFWNHDLDALAQVASGHDAHVSQALVPRGGLSFHHCRTVHGSGPNISGEPRRAIAVHLQDGANEFRRFTSPDGVEAGHGLDGFVRKLPDGRPDYGDPAMCPPIWPT